MPSSLHSPIFFKFSLVSRNNFIARKKKTFSSFTDRVGICCTRLLYERIHCIHPSHKTKIIKLHGKGHLLNQASIHSRMKWTDMCQNYVAALEQLTGLQFSQHNTLIFTVLQNVPHPYFPIYDDFQCSIMYYGQNPFLIQAKEETDQGLLFAFLT